MREAEGATWKERGKGCSRTIGAKGVIANTRKTNKKSRQTIESQKPENQDLRNAGLLAKFRE